MSDFFPSVGVALLLVLAAHLQAVAENPPAQTSQRAPGRRQVAELVRSPGVLIIAHRGASGHAPENTMPAFAAAINARADLVELDYYHSSDDQMIVFHDKELDRTTDAKQRFGGEKIPTRSKSLEELRQLDAGTWYAPQFANARIPTLAEALAAIQPHSTTLIERKEGPAKPLVQLLRSDGLIDKVVVQAFDWEFLRDCHRLAPDLVLGALGEKELGEPQLREIREAGAQVVGWKHQDLTEDNVALAQKHGLQVWTYTVNDPARARQLVSWGVNGLITDVPAEIRSAVESDRPISVR